MARVIIVFCPAPERKQINLVPREHEPAIWRDEAEFSGVLPPPCESDTRVEDREFDFMREGMRAARSGEEQEQVWHAGDLGGEDDGPCCQGGEDPARRG